MTTSEHVCVAASGAIRAGRGDVTDLGVRHGHDPVRAMAALHSQALECTCAYKMRLIRDGIALPEWAGLPPAGSVQADGDSYVISGGMIRSHTLHDTLTPAG